MKILVCPDKFKGSITAKEFCDVAKEVFISKKIELITIPLADGGEGSLNCIENNMVNAKRIDVKTFDALGRPINSQYLINNDIAYIELALQSGLTIIKPAERNVMKSSTFGTGVMLKHAINAGVKKIYLFVGGSATNDGGLGIAQSCGFNFYKDNNELIENNLSDFIKINKIETNNEIDFSKSEIILATDVKNSLLGGDGATKTFGPQKGISEEMFPIIEDGMINLNNVIKNYSGVDAALLEGSGAAGGVAAAICGLMKGKIISATGFIFNLCNLEKQIEQADLVITGEGKFDIQSLNGKLVGEVINNCKMHDKKCIVICGVSELPDNQSYEVISFTSDVKFDTTNSISTLKFHLTKIQESNDDILSS